MKAECWNCGVVEEFKIDGYSFGDRLLEGVMFTINKEGKARIQEEDAGYFKGLNKEHWLKLAEECAGAGGEGVDDGVCLQCGGDVTSDACLQWTKENL